MAPAFAVFPRSIGRQLEERERERGRGGRVGARCRYSSSTVVFGLHDIGIVSGRGVMVGEMSGGRHCQRTVHVYTGTHERVSVDGMRGCYEVELGILCTVPHEPRH
jgi:hypothetical protein